MFRFTALRVLPFAISAPTLFLGAGCTENKLTQVGTEDRFLQGGEEVSADILFVVDDSASMTEEQARLGENFSAFVEVLSGTFADWQIGVITTDPEEYGALRGAILTPDTPLLDAAFAAAVDVGNEGSRDEQGLLTSALAMSPSLNPGLVRANSALNVVYVSDEDDHSPDVVDVYMAVLTGAAGSGGFRAHALVGDLPEGCVSGTSAADAGTRYLDAVSGTDGWSDSICADDYSALLARVGLDVAGWDTTFYLDRVPDPATLEVSVDTVLIPERADDGWQYSSGDNAIVFEGYAVPRPGMEVVVRYEPWMGAG
ncbi:MAG: hypothetical protein EXR69_09365 [Myxococcales bacterium]|nr:hypothetical protein [Myxococcales bacterium]